MFSLCCYTFGCLYQCTLFSFQNDLQCIKSLLNLVEISTEVKLCLCMLHGDIFSLFQVRQGHAGSKSLLWQNPPVLTWESQLTQVDLYNAMKWFSLLLLYVAGLRCMFVSWVRKFMQNDAKILQWWLKEKPLSMQCAEFAACLAKT